MTRIPITLGLALAAALLALAAPAGAESFRIVDQAEGNLVKFESKATLESFDGTTSSVRGSVSLDPHDLGEHFEIEVEVDLRTLDTGISMRDRHMRENHLETDEFPIAVFEGAQIVEGAGTDLTTGGTHEILIEGQMEIHGVAQMIQVPLELTLDGADLHIVSRFGVALSDHDIERPRFLVLRLGDVQMVTVDVVAGPE